MRFLSATVSRCILGFATLVLLAALSMTAQAKSNASASASVFAFVHVNVIPMNDERVLDDQTVIIQDGTILTVGPAGNVKVPIHARRLDSRGKYLMPGLTDAHVHVETPTELPLYLANGVTTVFNLNGRPAHLVWRKRVADGDLIGPTIFTTGPIFNSAHTAEEAVHMVDEQAALGYDAVKIYNRVSKAEYPALIGEAKRKNLLLMGHVAREPEFELTLASGQSIAHLEEFTYTFFNPKHDANNSHIVYDESKIPEAVKLTAQAGIFVTPTLSTYATIVQQATALDEFLKNPDLKYHSPWIQDALQPATNRYKNRFDPPSYPRIQTSLAFQRKLVKALAASGVPLLCGTDASEVGPVPGFGIHAELQELVNDGLTPFQALQTATVNPARYFGRVDEVGMVEPGMRADLVLLRENPLASITGTRTVAGVMIHGRWLDSKQLTRMVNEVPQAYTRQVRDTQRQLETNPEAALAFLAENDPFGDLGGTALAQIMATRGFDKMRDVIVKIRQINPKSTFASEEYLNDFGYSLQRRKQYKDAIAVLRLNTEAFPTSANTWDSLADAQFQSGDVPHAIGAYKKALEVDPKYANAEEAKKFLAEHEKGK